MVNAGGHINSLHIGHVKGDFMFIALIIDPVNLEGSPLGSVLCFPGSSPVGHFFYIQWA